MCGVFGFVGRKSDVGAAIVTALKTLEYRGYDSWGLAVASDEGLIIDKASGRLNGKTPDYPMASAGIGHTRWATHGGVTAANAHPHVDEGQRIAVVHNGIIENHAQLKAELASRGHSFQSETDSEVVVHLVEELLASGLGLSAAVARTFERLDGYNAVVVLDREGPEFAAVKRVSPLVLGEGTDGATIASDAVAIYGHADSLIYLEDDQLARLRPSGIEILDRVSLEPISPVRLPAVNVWHDVDRGDYPHFMAKEVAEQPEALRRLMIEGREEIRALAGAIQQASKVILVGCGTAANAAMAGMYYFSEIANLDVQLVPASEFRYRCGPLNEETLVIALSQSGETIDVLEAMALARGRGAKLAAIVNAPNSSLDRMVETRVLLRTGIEQCVLATKSYTAMLATLLATAFAIVGNSDDGVAAVLDAAVGIERGLEEDAVSKVQRIAARVALHDHLYVIGRGIHYASALEAALKIKEVSYVHAEGFASGELKHGVIALIEPGTPCLVFAPSDATRVDVLSGAAELKSRGAHIIGVASEDDPIFDEFIPAAEAGYATPISESLPGQLLGYFAALARGNDPDRPRNLAKSVTVK